MSKLEELWELFGLRFKSHPWHGVSAGDKAPDVVNSFIEIVPSDHVKYEVDKDTGYLSIDRPHKFSNIVPALYGFIPKTYCDKAVAEHCMEKTGKTGIEGDGDPLDILVLTEREVPHGDLVVEAIPIGGFRMIDGGEADDKIIAVLKSDQVYGEWKDVSDIPAPILNRLLHYFLTYKEKPGTTEKEIEITDTYGKEEALVVIKKSQEDYENNYGNVELKLGEKLREVLKEEIKLDSI